MSRRPARLAAAAGFLLAAVLLQAEPANPVELYREGRQAQMRSELPRAVELYRAALQANPDYLEPMVGLAESFFMLEEYQEALQHVQRAEKYDRENLDLLILEGRIRIGLGQAEQAGTLFRRVLAREPNNLEARLGQAELDIMTGRRREAGQRYEELLRIRPESRKALLSLAMLHESEGDLEGAGRYVELALRYHSEDPQVHYAAARLSVSEHDYARAAAQLGTALALRGDYPEARRLLAQVYLLLERYDRAIQELRTILAQSRDDELAWYTLGLAYDGSRDTEQALRSLEAALRLRPDDEVARTALESIALAQLPIKDERRARYADYHLKEGRRFESRNLLDKAALEYRRALRLNPESRDARLAFAGIYRLMGYPVKYLRELQVLRKLGYTDPVIVDNIEIVSSQTYDTVAAKWGVDQYALDKERYTVTLFHQAPSSREMHPLAGKVLAGYFHDLLQRFPDIHLNEGTKGVGGYAEAFAAARQDGSDYFLLFHVEESERSFSVTLEQYLSRTGRKLASRQVFRTGNNRVLDAFTVISEQFHDALPLRGKLLERQFDQGIVDLGRVDGLKADDRLLVVKQGRVHLSEDAVALSVDERDIVGDFAVTALDEMVAAGTLTRRQFFDLINPGDEVIRPLPPPPEPEQPPPRQEGLLRRLFRLIGI